MKYLALLLIFGFGISGFGQTIKSLGYNTTNGQVVANTGTNVLTFTNSVSLSGVVGNNGTLIWNPTDNEFYTAATFNGEIAFNNTTNAAATRTNLGLGAPWLTNTTGGVYFLNALWETTGQGGHEDFGAWAFENLWASQARGLIDNEDNSPDALSYASIGDRWTIASPEYFVGKLFGFDAGDFGIADGVKASIFGYQLGSTDFDEWTRDNLRAKAAIQLLDSADADTPVFFYNSQSTNKWTIPATSDFRKQLGFATNLDTLWTAANFSNARSSMGLGATWLTNTNVTNFRSAIGLGNTNNVTFESLTVNSGGDVVVLNGVQMQSSFGMRISFEENIMEVGGDRFLFTCPNTVFDSGPIWVNGPIYFQADWDSPVTNNALYAAITRTNLGLGWSALTNSNAATSLLGTLNGNVIWTNTNTLSLPTDLLIGPSSSDPISFSYGQISSAFGQVLQFEESQIYGWSSISADEFYGRLFGLSDSAIELQEPFFQVPALYQNKDANTNNSGWFVADTGGFRSAIGLGGGITTNRTFVSYNGTNYTTNVVTISNGIITGWTQ